jgi:hypothetical protein
MAPARRSPDFNTLTGESAFSTVDRQPGRDAFAIFRMEKAFPIGGTGGEDV